MDSNSKYENHHQTSIRKEEELEAEKLRLGEAPPPPLGTSKIWELTGYDVWVSWLLRLLLRKWVSLVWVV